jgi:probable rRNA maturation factor
MATVHFFNEQIRFKIPNPRKTASWVKRVIEEEGMLLSSINFIICSDNFLAELNLKYLKHKTLTDIITFDNSEEEGTIQGDIFISLPRVKENSKKFGTTLDNELHRVMIHGVLHLMGYSDKSVNDKLAMRRKEDTYLSLRT